jgi:hypothetical protein
MCVEKNKKIRRTGRRVHHFLFQLWRRGNFELDINTLAERW